MHSEAQDVVVMTEVKALRVLLSVIHHSHCRHMIHHLTRLSVKQIIPAVTAPVPETQTHTPSTTTADIWFQYIKYKLDKNVCQDIL